MSSPPRARWLSTLGSGGKWLAGVVIVAVVGVLVGILVPRLFGPQELAAELSRVSIQAGMTLNEYAIRRQEQDSADSERSAALRSGAAMVMISAPQTETTPPTTTSTTTTPTTTTPTTTGTTPTTTTRASGADAGRPNTPTLSPAAQESLSQGIADAVEATPQALILSPDCIDNPLAESCGLSSLVTAMNLTAGATSIDTISQAGIARELTRVFRGTRTVRSPDDPDKRELVGAAVDFNVALTGFRGRRVHVRWSLYSARQGIRVPRAWLRNQRVMLLRGEADKDSASGQFWVPIPQLRGPFFIRIGVYNDRGSRLDYADTDPFR